MQDPYNRIPCIYFSVTDHCIAEVSDMLCHTLGYDREALVGQRTEFIFTLSTRIFQQTHLYPLLGLKGTAEEIYITLRSKNGNDVPVLMNAAQGEKEGRIYRQFAGIAIEKRKEFEEEILAAKKAAEKALKEHTALKTTQESLQKHAEELDIQIGLANLQNQELRQFNHLATHTLQEPIRKLLFFSSQLLETETDGKMQPSVQKIRTAAENLAEKLKGLQQLVWLADEKKESEDLALLPLLEKAREQVENENAGISIVLESEAIPNIEAAKEHVFFLFKELFANAVKFRKSGNVVHVKIQASTLLLNKFRQLPEKYKYVPFLKLAFQDDGIGFDAQYQEQAFDFFRKMHTFPSSGSGIGLSLCRKIVESYSGAISLESEVDRGTTVILYLPLKQESFIS